MAPEVLRGERKMPGFLLHSAVAAPNSGQLTKVWQDTMGWRLMCTPLEWWCCQPIGSRGTLLLPSTVAGLCIRLEGGPLEMTAPLPMAVDLGGACPGRAIRWGESVRDRLPGIALLMMPSPADIE